MIEFVSYDGKWPNLCSGTLVLKINGEEIVSSKLCMCSGGSVTFDADWNETVTQGPWTVDVPDELLDYKEEIEKVVNDNVLWGCCGGCV